MNLAAGINLTLLKTEITGLVKTEGKKTEVLIAPTNAQEAPTLSIAELKEELKKSFNIKDADPIEIAIKGLENITGGAFDLKKLKFQLNQVFLYVTKEGDEDAVTEYAFSIKIITEGAIPSFGFLTLKSLSLAIWNTDRVNIANKMNIGDFTKLLTK